MKEISRNSPDNPSIMGDSPSEKHIDTASKPKGVVGEDVYNP